MSLIRIRAIPSTYRTRKTTWFVIRYLIILVVLAFYLFPLFWIVSTSLKLPDEYIHSPPIYIPRQPHLNHYIRGMGPTGDGAVALRDSLIVTVGDVRTQREHVLCLTASRFVPHWRPKTWLAHRQLVQRSTAPPY